MDSEEFLGWKKLWKKFSDINTNMTNNVNDNLPVCEILDINHNN